MAVVIPLKNQPKRLDYIFWGEGVPKERTGKEISLHVTATFCTARCKCVSLLLISDSHIYFSIIAYG